MSTIPNKVSFVEKIGYSLGDFAANLIFQTLMTYLSFYYVNVCKIEEGAASLIIFIGGMVGALFNPIMGMIADRTNTRWGKFRPWILWTALPFGIMAMLAFSIPSSLGPTAKIIYCVVTFMLLELVYVANNLPYSALSGVITGDMAERNSISSVRFVFVMVAQFVVQSLLRPLVLIVGNGNEPQGFSIIMTSFAVIGVIFLVITFFTTHERIKPIKEEVKEGVKINPFRDLKDLSKTLPWILMLIIVVFVFITLALKGNSYVFYFQYYLDKQGLISFLDSFGFIKFINSFTAIANANIQPDVWAFGLFNAIGIVFMIIGIAFSKKLADKYGKRDVFGFGLIIATLCLLAFYFYSSTSIGLVFITQILHGFFYGLTIPLLWSMIADVADYFDWKNARRATAMTFSAMIFGLWVGITIGGSLVSILLKSFGYDKNSAIAQSVDTLNGIKLLVSVIPTITFLVAFVCLFLYKINKKTEVAIQTDLMKRREESK